MGNEQPVSPRLLIVDDSLDILESLQMVVEDLGYQADTACGGLEAIERIRTARYALVLCDVGMPDLNGWQVARKINALSPGTKVFLLTGHADQISAGDRRTEPIDGVLPKPIDLERLEQFLRDQLAGSRD
jgi:CheY-like chemotaxis protein